MKILLITKVKNEADIIEYFIRYHLNIVDRVVVIDNGSTDGTYDIVLSLIREGLSVDLVNEGFSKFDALRFANQYTEFYLKKYECDFVIFADADELISCDNGDNPRKIIETFDNDKIYYCKWKTFLYAGVDEHSAFTPELYNEYRDEIYEKFEKIIIPAPMFYKYKIVVEAGNHSCHSTIRDMNPPARLSSKEIKFSHYPIRSMNQYRKQIILNSIFMMSNPDVNLQTGAHWKYMFGLKAADIDLRRLSMKYAYYEGDDTIEKECKHYIRIENKYNHQIIWDLEKILFDNLEILSLLNKKYYTEHFGSKKGGIDVAVWGTGEFSKKMIGRIPEECDIQVYVDSDKNKQFGMFNGKIVVTPEKLRFFDFDIILIASDKFENEIRMQIKNIIPFINEKNIYSIEEYIIENYRIKGYEKMGMWTYDK